METVFTMLVLWQLLDMRLWLLISVVSQVLSYIKMLLTTLLILWLSSNITKVHLKIKQMFLQCAYLMQHLMVLGKKIQIQPFLLKLLTMLITTSFLLFFACSHYQLLSTFQLNHIIQLVQITQRIHWHICLTAPLIPESGKPVFKQIGFIFSVVLLCHWTPLKQELSPKPKIIMLPFANQN